jgi:hypothetical protein
MHFPYKNEYRMFKLVEITIRRGLREKGDKWRDWNNLVYSTYIYMEMSMKLPV